MRIHRRAPPQQSHALSGSGGPNKPCVLQSVYRVGRHELADLVRSIVSSDRMCVTDLPLLLRPIEVCQFNGCQSQAGGGCAEGCGAEARQPRLGDHRVSTREAPVVKAIVVHLMNVLANHEVRSWRRWPFAVETHSDGRRAIVPNRSRRRPLADHLSC